MTIVWPLEGTQETYFTPNISIEAHTGALWHKFEMADREERGDQR